MEPGLLHHWTMSPGKVACPADPRAVGAWTRRQGISPFFFVGKAGKSKASHGGSWRMTFFLYFCSRLLFGEVEPGFRNPDRTTGDCEAWLRSIAHGKRKFRAIWGWSSGSTSWPQLVFISWFKAFKQLRGSEIQTLDPWDPSLRLWGIADNWSPKTLWICVNEACLSRQQVSNTSPSVLPVSLGTNYKTTKESLNQL